MAAIELTQVQRECLEHRGVCDGCPNNILESGPCQVKYSQGVAKKLGIRAHVAKNPCKLKEPIAKVCQLCGLDFMCWFKNGKFCNQCAATRTNDSESLRTCRWCGRKFFGTTGKTMCPTCKAAKRASA